MPVYDYKCAQHGLFNDLASTAESSKPQACPECGNLAARVIMLAPNFRQMPDARRKAFEINERSSHEPVVSTEDQRQHDSSHRKTCGCDSEIKQRQMLYTADGSKIFPSARPWMISH